MAKSKVGSQSTELPQSKEAERSILGVIIKDNDTALKIFPILKPEHFYYEGHRLVYRAMHVLSAAGKPIDEITLADFLTGEEVLEKAGGISYIAGLMDGVPAKLNVESYVQLVLDKAARRNLIQVCQQVIGQAADVKQKIQATADVGVQGMLSVYDREDDRPLMRNWNDVMQSAFIEMDEAATHPEKIARFVFGLPKLDKIAGGGRRQEVIVITGPSSHGKTALAEMLAIRAESENYKGIIFSAEMSGEQLALRQLARDALVPYFYVRRPERLNSEQCKLLLKAMAKKRSLHIVDRDITPARVWALSEAQKRMHGLDFVIVDYDQLVIEAGRARDDDDKFFVHQRHFILNAKRLAERLNVCFVLLAQQRKLNPAIRQRGRPTLDDLYGDSAMINTPHLILYVLRHFFLKNYDMKHEKPATVFILKNRAGPTGKADLFFDKNKVCLTEEEPVDDDSEEGPESVEATEGQGELLDTSRPEAGEK